MRAPTFRSAFTRRQVLVGAAALATGALLPLPLGAAERSYTLRAAPGRALLLGDGNPATGVWAYGGQVPGPVIRARQGGLDGTVDFLLREFKARGEHVIGLN